LCGAAKDISMAGALGTTLMLLECSRVGALIRVDSIPRPACIEPASLLRWLSAFPSYGFVLSVDPIHVPAVSQRFAERDLAVAVIGEVTEVRQVRLEHDGDFADQPFMTGASERARVADSSHA
jgi:selenophosphate synthetase-related protein